jgi:ribosomal protein L11 methyltransferase
MKTRVVRISVGDAEVLLGPGKAFGSGEHETTRGCLELLGRLPGLEGATVLDVGCGTGILGIAALKLGAGSVVALDVDPKAIETARANAALNSVSDRIRLLVGDVHALGPAQFDLVLANLYGDLILSSLDSIVAHPKPGGTLLLSGIKWEERREIETGLLRRGLTLEKRVMLEEYVTIVAGREPDPMRDP